LPLVLASNEANATDRYAWKDITGVRYHYPNGYRNLIRTGDRFVYYRGVRRARGPRGPAEYFGQGIIGDIWPDPASPPGTPKRKWAWYCAIEDYAPFVVPVPAKIDGVFFETISSNKWRNGGMWRNGVRKLSQENFERILIAAGAPAEATDTNLLLPLVLLPDLAAVQLKESLTDLMVPRSAIAVVTDGESDRGRQFSARRSRNAKIVGHRAEEITMRYLHEILTGATHIRHVAISGETPGWDIEYTDLGGQLNAVEVKGASGTAFTNFEFTQGELEAARRLGSRYWIYLVADCLGTRPKLYRIQDPASLIDKELLSATPIAWRIWRI
jgi:hypothetical protein